MNDAVGVAEEFLATLPGSRHSSCVCDVDERAAYFRDDPSDRVCLRFGRINNHSGGCLHVEVSDEHGETFYTVWICDEIVPIAIRFAIARQIPAMLRFVAHHAQAVAAVRAETLAKLVERAAATMPEPGQVCCVKPR
ncbi:hypothetical protein Mal15_42590 [Stieleria maiorica]|uniref:Uncharacterized protein n=2 Tax=Stieleria maiorica TaxID=2795974 RepID=A0A5B9MI62_9BACT|nr:hypothetical protein Mal15_42590 [Stieleria maiorica]